MGDDNVVHLHNGASFRCLESEIRQFTGKWMELETVILSEDTQTQKDEHHMFSSSGDANFESLDACVVCFIWDSYGAQEISQGTEEPWLSRKRR